MKPLPAKTLKKKNHKYKAIRQLPNGLRED